MKIKIQILNPEELTDLNGGAVPSCTGNVVYPKPGDIIYCDLRVNEIMCATIETNCKGKFWYDNSCAKANCPEEYNRHRLY